MKYKKIILFIFILFINFYITSCKNIENDNISIISTNYVGYDFAKNITKDIDVDTKMLLKPGCDVHNYSPSTKDVIDIINCNLFIYVGGESDSIWVEKNIIPQIDKNKTIIISMFDVLKNDSNANLYYEEELDNEKAILDEYDEHIWNDYNNSLIILNAILNSLKEISPNNIDILSNNYEKYKNAILNIKNDIEKLVLNKSIYMIFADRFPLLYFVKSYNIKYDAALKGCSNNVSIGAKSLIRLKNEIENNELKYIFTIELSSNLIANTIIEEIKNDKSYSGPIPEVKTFYSMHNISKEDFENEITFVDFMQKNYETLKLLIN